MAVLELLTVSFIVIAAIALVIAAIPFWIALRLLGAETSLLSVAFASLLGTVLQAAVKLFVTGTYGVFAGILAAYLAWVVFIKFYFDLSFARAIAATVLPGVVLAGIIVLGLLVIAL